MDPEGRAPIRWEAPEYTYHAKNTDWYWGLGLIALAGAGLSLYLGNYLLAIVIVLGALVLGMHARREPRIVTFEINDLGIAIDNRLYLYDQLKYFAIIDTDDGETEIILESKKTWLPHTIIPLADVATSDVREYLATNLTERKELEEPLLEQVMRILRL